MLCVVSFGQVELISNKVRSLKQPRSILLRLQGVYLLSHKTRHSPLFNWEGDVLLRFVDGCGYFLSSCVFSHGNFLPRLVYMMMMCNLYMRPWSRSVCWRLFFVQLGDGACASVLLEFPTLDDWIYNTVQ